MFKKRKWITILGGAALALVLVGVSLVAGGAVASAAPLTAEDVQTLTASDLEDPGERGGPWWGYAPGKHALEWLFARGRITAYRTPRFGRVYDIPERVIPQWARERSAPDRDAAYRLLLMDAAKHHGVGTVADLADYHRLNKPHARAALADLVAEGALTSVTVDGWHHEAFLHPGAVLPRRVAAATVLSPFDSLVWHRDRVERLFGFRYRIEIYVPRPQRIYGYYVLPFLLDGHLVGRVDLKAERDAGRLLVRASHIEEGHDPDRVAGALARELETLSEWLELDDVVVEEVGGLAYPLRRALGAVSRA